MDRFPSSIGAATLALVGWKVAGMTDLRLARVPRGLPDTGRRVEGRRPVASVDKIDVYVGSRLRARRTELGVSQGRLGRQLGLTFSQIQKYEKGTNRIGAGRLYHAAALLGVPVPYFFEGLESSEHEFPSMSEVDLAADARRIHDLFARISDPNARQALLALASSVADNS
jgi:transcriptional regulator with XRE-family HTH domain